MSRGERSHCVRVRGRHNVWTTTPMPLPDARVRDVTAIEYQLWIDSPAGEKPAPSDATEVTAAATAAQRAYASGGVVAGGTEFLRQLTQRGDRRRADDVVQR